MNKIRIKIKSFFKKIGPGFITGVADDDPSGIGTYSIAGAQFGYKMNWMTIFLLPAMIAIQEMCGRLGLVTGMGLAGVIKKHSSRKILYMAVTLLAVANIINIGADLGIMAASMQMLLGFPFYYWLIIIAIFVIWMEIAIPYKNYSKYLKFLGLTLCVYIITAFLVDQDWKEVALNTLVPHIQLNSVYIMTMIGFIGTTISPYLFFWQPSEEIEEEICEGKIKDFNCKPNINIQDIKVMTADTKFGMLFSNTITFFVLLTTAATLHANGITDIETPQQAAMALKPLAGNGAYLLFAIGMIGVGLQAIPVLAGSIGYAISETFGFKEGLSKKFFKAKAFYFIIAFSTIIGVLMNLFGINTMQALYYAAIINGIASIPLIAIIIKLSDDEKIVGKYRTKKHSKIIGMTVLAFITLAAIIMVANLFGFEF
ncbi:MAG: divalent metal cation transporter [Candidatus Moranbacteria bacterium]|nr:divalent metal cation transporter [Candidatus Moranbacteria bacterium]